LLRDRIIAIILLENLHAAGAVKRAQDNGIRLKMRRDVGDLNMVNTRVQIQRQLFPHHRELLVINRQCRSVAFLIRISGGPN